MKQQRAIWNCDLIFDTDKSREKKNCDTSQSLLKGELKKSVKTLRVSWIWRHQKKVSKHWGFLDFEDLTKKIRQNECYKIKFINDKNQTHQSQTSKTEALQVNNFQSVTFVYWPFYQRIWAKILHGSKDIFLSDSSM